MSNSIVSMLGDLLENNKYGRATRAIEIKNQGFDWYLKWYMINSHKTNKADWSRI